MGDIPDHKFTFELEQILEDSNAEWEWSTPATAIIPNIERTLDPDSDDSDSETELMGLSLSEHLPRGRTINNAIAHGDQPSPGPVIHAIEKSGRVLNICISPERPAHPPSPLGALAISNSRFTATMHTLKTLEPHKTLLVLNVTAHPAPNCRFLNAAVTWAFRRCTETDSGTGGPAPRVLGIAPQHTVGGWTPEQTGCIRAVGGTAFPSPTSVLCTMTIEGSIRGGASRCVWTVEENASSQCGIPDQLQFAVALEHSGKFELELDMHGELGSGSFSAPIAAKRGGLVKVIDAGAELGQVEWKNYLKGITGRLPPATNSL